MALPIPCLLGIRLTKNVFSHQNVFSLFYTEGRRSTSSRRDRAFNEDPSKLTQMLCSPSSITVKSTKQSFCYPYKPSEMIYAQGSHRSLVLVNGGIGNNTIQKELEEKLWMTNPVTNF